MPTKIWQNGTEPKPVPFLRRQSEIQYHSVYRNNNLSNNRYYEKFRNNNTYRNNANNRFIQVRPSRYVRDVEPTSRGDNSPRNMQQRAYHISAYQTEQKRQIASILEQNNRYNNRENNKRRIVKTIKKIINPTEDTVTIKLNPESCTMQVTFPDGTKLSCLVDTGAADSIVSEGLIKRSNYLSSLPQTKENSGKRYITGNNQAVFSDRTIAFDFTVQGQKLSTIAHILPTCGSFGMIYGLSSMQSAKAKIDISNNLLKLNTKQIPLRPKQYITLKPGESKIIQLSGAIPKSLDQLSMIMSFSAYAKSTKPPESMISIQGKSVIICLTNTSKRKQIIKPNKVVGFLQVNSLLENTEEDSCKHIDLPLASNGKQKQDTLNTSTVSYTDNKRHDYGGAWKADISQLEEARHLIKGAPIKPVNRHITARMSKLKQKRLEELSILEEDNPDLYLSDEEILRRDIPMNDSLLSNRNKEKLMAIILNNAKAFSLFGEVGKCDSSEVSITLQNDEPFFVRPFRYSEDDKLVIRREIQKMIAQGVLVKSPATHVSPVLLVKKKLDDGTMKYRIVVDFRTLNQKLLKPIYAQNLIQDAINKIGESGAKYISLIDLKEAYHALVLDKNSRKYTGVIPYYGHCSLTYQRLPMGLSISGAEFTNKILEILDKLPDYQDYCCNILDDLLIYSETQEDHIKHMSNIIKLFNEEGLKISPKKTKVAQHKFSYMGYEITFNKAGLPVIKIEKSKVHAITQLSKPKTPKQVRSFIGMIQYLSRFLPRLNISLIPLYELTKKTVPFKWTDKHQEIFEKLKEAVTTAPAVSLPTRTGIYILEIDSSREGTGAVLKQMQNGTERIIAFNSKKLSNAAQNYSVSELELTGILINLQCFKTLLGNRHFYVTTDHKSLLGLLKSKSAPPTARLAKLVEKLLAFDFSLSYKKGSTLIVADYLSRNLIDTDDPNSKATKIAFLEMSKAQAEATLDSLLIDDKQAISALTRSQAKQQNITVPAVHKINQKIDSTTTDNKISQPNDKIDKNEQSTPKTIVNEESTMTRLRSMNKHIPPELWPNQNEQTNKTEQTKTQARQSNYLFQLPIPEKPISNAEYEQTHGITGEEDTIKAIMKTDEAQIDTETQLDIEKHLLQTNGLYIKEVINQPDENAITEETQQLFSKIGKAKLYSYRFSKQKDINPLLRIIDQRHLSQYKVGFSKQKLTTETKEDRRYGPIYNYLLSGKMPKKQLDTENILATADNYFIYDDALFYYEMVSDNTDMSYKLCIPKSLTRYILDTYHRQNIGAHLGITRTYSTLNAKYRIHGLYRSIVNYIKSCEICQQRHMKVADKTIIFPRELNAEMRPFQTFSCDLRNMNTSSGGHKFLFVAVCELTHYIEAIPIKQATAKSIANILLNKFIFKYGKPEMILFDLARYFCSKIMAYLSEAINFKIKFVYKSQHHASRVERYMRSIKNVLISNLSGKMDLWPCFIDASVYALNTFKSPALSNYCAYELVFKQSPSTFDDFNLQPVAGICKDLNEYITLVKSKFEIARKNVNDYQKKRQDRQFMESAREYTHRPVTTGQLVLLLNPENTEVFSSESAAIKMEYVGPYIVAGRDKSAIFLEKLDGTYVAHPVYAQRVKPASILTKEGKVLKTKNDVITYLETRTDLSAAMLQKALNGGLLKVTDTDGIVAEKDNSLMTITKRNKNSELPTNWEIPQVGRPLATLNEQEKELNAKRQNAASIGKAGTHEITKARFKDSKLQILLKHENDNTGKNSFWVHMEESVMYEKLLSQLQNNTIKLTGTPMKNKSKGKETIPESEGNH